MPWRPWTSTRGMAGVLICVLLLQGCARHQQDAVERQRPGGHPVVTEVGQDLQLLRDVKYGHGGDSALRMDILHSRRPAPHPRPVFVWIHGGGWRVGDKRSGRSWRALMARNGYFCVSIDYRLTDEAVFPAQIEDCKCAIRFLRAHADRFGIAPDRIGVAGESAGGHLAALLAASGGAAELEGKGGWPGVSSRVQAVCDFFGPADLSAMPHLRHPLLTWRRVEPTVGLLGGLPEKRPRAAKRASPITHVSPDDPPILIIHGQEDPAVPYQQSVRLKEALDRAGVPATLVGIPAAGHGGAAFQSDEVREQVLGFFDRYLKPAADGDSAEQ